MQNNPSGSHIMFNLRVSKAFCYAEEQVRYGVGEVEVIIKGEEGKGGGGRESSLIFLKRVKNLK